MQRSGRALANTDTGTQPVRPDHKDLVPFEGRHTNNRNTQRKTHTGRKDAKHNYTVQQQRGTRGHTNKNNNNQASTPAKPPVHPHPTPIDTHAKSGAMGAVRVLLLLFFFRAGRCAIVSECQNQ